MSESAPVNGNAEKVEYHVTVPRELAEALAEHYHDNSEVRSVPDALRQAGREVVDKREAGE